MIPVCFDHLSICTKYEGIKNCLINYNRKKSRNCDNFYLQKRLFILTLGCGDIIALCMIYSHQELKNICEIPSAQLYLADAVVHYMLTLSFGINYGFILSDIEFLHLRWDRWSITFPLFTIPFEVNENIDC